ncbi:hypothetical protein AMQ83_00520 [Paenibacillus riograndensis]|nr:hypothetical protein AMQ83_00520 [Paenibacillus riograndensis]
MPVIEPPTPVIPGTPFLEPRVPSLPVIPVVVRPKVLPSPATIPDGPPVPLYLLIPVVFPLLLAWTPPEASSKTTATYALLPATTTFAERTSGMAAIRSASSWLISILSKVLVLTPCTELTPSLPSWVPRTFWV